MRNLSFRIIITASLLILFCAVYTHSEEISITTNDGTVTVGKIIRAEPDGVMIEIPLGVKKIYYKDMPAETASKYGYDQQKEEDYKKQVELEKKQAELKKKTAAYLRDAAKLEKTTPVFDRSDLKIGNIGKVSKAKLIQILGTTSMMVEITVGDKNPAESSTSRKQIWSSSVAGSLSARQSMFGIGNQSSVAKFTVWVEGISTKGLADEQYIELPILKVIEVKTYTTGFGSQTVLVLTPAILPPSPDALLDNGNKTKKAKR